MGRTAFIGVRDMGDNGDDKITIGRGPSYPSIDLERAIERVDQIAAKGAERSKMPPETFYKLWGYGPKSSGARQTIAALGYYNLVSYAGKGNDRRVTLTDLARRIVLDRRPGSEERKRAVAAAALEPPIFRELYEAYGPLLPDRTVMESFLTIEKGFNQQGAEAAITNFIATVEYADLDKPAGSPDKDVSQTRENDVQFGGARVGDLIDWEAGGALCNETPLRVRAIAEDQGQTWVFVDGSESGIPMEQVIVQERPKDEGARKPPTLPLDATPLFEEKPPAEAKRWSTDLINGPLDVAFDRKTVVVQGRSGSAEELGEFIEALQELKSILEKSATKKNRFLSAVEEEGEA
jgi:hypothetical protein